MFIESRSIIGAINSFLKKECPLIAIYIFRERERETRFNQQMS